MDEYISREDYCEENCGKENREGYRTCTNCGMLNISSADVQPVIHAHWIRGEEKGFRTYNPLWYCSNCGGQIRYDTRMRQYQKTKRPVWEVNAFCRKCGARMDGDTE
jgi:hypothetical protein